MNQQDLNTVRLMRKYDKMKRELADLEHELSRACVTYGQRRGYLCGFRIDHARLRMAAEEEQAHATAA